MGYFRRLYKLKFNLCEPRRTNKRSRLLQRVLRFDGEIHAAVTSRTGLWSLLEGHSQLRRSQCQLRNEKTMALVENLFQESARRINSTALFSALEVNDYHFSDFKQ
jgi:hypothetical protein